MIPERARKVDEARSSTGPLQTNETPRLFRPRASRAIAVANAFRPDGRTCLLRFPYLLKIRHSRVVLQSLARRDAVFPSARRRSDECARRAPRALEHPPPRHELARDRSS